MITYAIGDIHGRVDLFKAARTLIRADSLKHKYKDVTVVYLGDYVDRGPTSKQVLDELLDKPLGWATEIALRGNHEDIMLDGLGLGNQPFKELGMWRSMWLQNGGIRTIQSYGVGLAIQNDEKYFHPDNWDWERIYEEIPKKHVDFLRELPYYYDDGEHLFVHAGVNPHFPIDDRTWQTDQVYSWSRDHTLVDAYKTMNGETRTLVHGHTPTRNGLALDVGNRVNLDNGAYKVGKQAVGVFGETGKRRILYAS